MEIQISTERQKDTLKWTSYGFCGITVGYLAS